MSNELRTRKLRSAVNLLHSTKLFNGSPYAKFWFIGLEGGNHPAGMENVERFLMERAKDHERFNAGNHLSLRRFECTPTECSSHCPTQRGVVGKIYHPCRYRGNVDLVKWQPTYAGYIKLLLSITKPDWTRFDVKEYQRLHLGEYESDTVDTSALLELYPLDCQRKEEWPYLHLAEITGLDYLESADRYREWVRAPEWAKIFDKIIQYQPQYAIVFGKDIHDLAFARDDLGIVNTTYRAKTGGKAVNTAYARLGQTQLVFATHPGRIVPDDYWRSIATFLQGPGSDAEKAA